MKNDTTAMPARPGTVTPVPQAGSYKDNKAAGEMASVAKVASGSSKTSNDSAAAKNLGKLGDHNLCCNS
jgi:hypothetical protein